MKAFVVDFVDASGHIGEEKLGTYPREQLFNHLILFQAFDGRWNRQYNRLGFRVVIAFTRLSILVLDLFLGITLDAVYKILWPQGAQLF